MGPEEAVIEASHQRLRPILMTTACAFLGGVPMILGNGTGSRIPSAARLGDLRGDCWCPRS
ncbi:MAG: efflux RND transporter permease subunit [Caulobacteraceae bacterium]